MSVLEYIIQRADEGRNLFKLSKSLKLIPGAIFLVDYFWAITSEQFIHLQPLATEIQETEFPTNRSEIRISLLMCFFHIFLWKTDLPLNDDKIFSRVQDNLNQGLSSYQLASHYLMLIYSSYSVVLLFL